LDQPLVVVEFALSQSSPNRPRVARVALAVINGCLVFTTALGGNQIATRSPSPQAEQPRTTLSPSSTPTLAPHRPFLHDWLR
jgi:hypothetical protein